MTLANTTTSITVTGDTLTSVFSYDFPMGGSSNYAVLVFTDAAGVESTIASASFSITGVTVSTGGTFTYPLSGSPITAGESLTLYRTVPLTQNVAISNQGNFYPSVVEGGLDYEMMAIQQLERQINAAGGALDASSLFGNPTTASAAGASVTLGSGLSFSGNTLVVSGVSGSGTVTQVNTGNGLTGGPVTGVGTVSLSTITTGYVLANFSGATAAPRGVLLSAGDGITLSSTTTSLVIAGTSRVLISELTAAVVTASFAFSSITSSYRDLEIRIRGRTSEAASDTVVRMQFNGDTGSNYNSERAYFFAATMFAAESLGTTSGMCAALAGASAATSYAGGNIVTVLDYRGTTFFKAYSATGGASFTTATTKTNVNGFGGLWLSTSAVTSVTVFPQTGSFVTGSICSLYGLL